MTKEDTIISQRKDYYLDYTKWCRENNIFPMSFCNSWLLHLYRVISKR